MFLREIYQHLIKPDVLKSKDFDYAYIYCEIFLVFDWLFVAQINLPQRNSSNNPHKHFVKSLSGNKANILRQRKEEIQKKKKSRNHIQKLLFAKIVGKRNTFFN